jgi:hypothetical protein
MVKTNLTSSKTMRRAQSDAGSIGRSNSTRGPKPQRPIPRRAMTERSDNPKGLPPTPPSETEGYGGLQRSRSRSQPSARSSGGSSDYTPPARPRLPTVRDDDDRRRQDADMRRTRSMNTTRRKDSEFSRPTDREPLRREPTRSRGRYENDEDDVYDIYNDYYDEKPVRAYTTRRPPARGPSRSRASSASRGRRPSVDDGYSDGEDEEFEMITPKRTEISKVYHFFIA